MLPSVVSVVLRGTGTRGTQFSVHPGSVPGSQGRCRVLV